MIYKLAFPNDSVCDKNKTMMTDDERKQTIRKVCIKYNISRKVYNMRLAETNTIKELEEKKRKLTQK